MSVDRNLRFRARDVQNRQIDTLIGICKGILADERVVQAEAEFLDAWLRTNWASVIENPVTDVLYRRVNEMMEDGVLDNEESQELFETLHKFSNNEGLVDGELVKPSALPITHPVPDVVFEGRVFVFTGTFSYGNRKECKEVTKSLGGICPNNVTKDIDYLILGDYVTPSWKHESWGLKIEKALDLANQGRNLAIVPEAHWREQGGISRR